MIDRPYLYPFYAEPRPRRDRIVLRPVVRFSIGDERLAVDALVDSGSEHVLADSTLAFAVGIDLAEPVAVEPIGIGGGFVEARFVEVQGFLHPPHRVNAEPVSWVLDVGFIDSWRPLYPCILGSIGFLNQFTVTMSRFAHTTAIEPLDVFDERFGLVLPA